MVATGAGRFPLIRCAKRSLMTAKSAVARILIALAGSNGKCSISMAACQKHISLYLNAEMIEQFRQRSNEFTIKKNAVYLPYDRKLPVNLIENVLEEYFRTA